MATIDESSQEPCLDAVPHAPAEVVDCLGLSCPLPLVRLAKAVAGVDVGAAVVLLSDDPGALVDVPVWCRLKDHELLAREDRPEGGWTFRVRRSR